MKTSPIEFKARDSMWQEKNKVFYQEKHVEQMISTHKPQLLDFWNTENDAIKKEFQIDTWHILGILISAFYDNYVKSYVQKRIFGIHIFRLVLAIWSALWIWCACCGASFCGFSCVKKKNHGIKKNVLVLQRRIMKKMGSFRNLSLLSCNTEW